MFDFAAHGYAQVDGLANDDPVDPIETAAREGSHAAYSVTVPPKCYWQNETETVPDPVPDDRFMIGWADLLSWHHRFQVRR
jgi:hypothetical protein